MQHRVADLPRVEPPVALSFSTRVVRVGSRDARVERLRQDSLHQRRLPATEGAASRRAPRRAKVDVDGEVQGPEFVFEPGRGALHGAVVVVGGVRVGPTGAALAVQCQDPPSPLALARALHVPQQPPLVSQHGAASPLHAAAAVAAPIAPVSAAVVVVVGSTSIMSTSSSIGSRDRFSPSRGGGTVVGEGDGTRSSRSPSASKASSTAWSTSSAASSPSQRSSSSSSSSGRFSAAMRSASASASARDRSIAARAASADDGAASDLAGGTTGAGAGFAGAGLAGDGSGESP
mmetsp:Transcript_5608/g.23086  ORF Transcript_5608/g.23086 Transcript_5608/m.23086 type:complete len:290 (-) Transcript_5608:97-966(-)